MSIYGLQIKDASGNSNLVLSDTATIISAGTVTMPDVLKDDNTYGYDIDLPGAAEIASSILAVIITPHLNLHFKCYCHYWISGGGAPTYPPNFYAFDDYTYYTKNDVTGVMTVYTPGDFTLGDPTEWDALFGIFPIVGWDRLTDPMTSVRLWAAACSIVFDGSDDTSKAIYSIGAKGIEKVDYAIFLKEWDY